LRSSRDDAGSRADQGDVDHWIVGPSPRSLQSTRRSRRPAGRGVPDRTASPPLAPHGGPMAPDPRTPVIVGVGQWSNRVDRGEDPVEPVDMMAEALRRAAADSGAGQAILAAFDAVRVVRSLSHRYRDPGALVAARVGATPRD